MPAKTFVLWSADGVGPVVAGDLDAVKAKAEKLVTMIVGATNFKWEKVEEPDGVAVENRLRLLRTNSASGKWIDVKMYIDEVELLVEKKLAGA